MHVSVSFYLMHQRWLFNCRTAGNLAGRFLAGRLGGECGAGGAGVCFCVMVSAILWASLFASCDLPDWTQAHAAKKMYMYL